MDAVGTALRGAAAHSVWAPLLALGAGLASSFGPCIAPRLLAVASLTAGTCGSKRWTRIGAFVLGLCASYVLLGTIAGALGYVARYSPYVYGLLGLTLLGAGIATIVRAPAIHGCAAHPRAGRNLPGSAAFVAGTAFAAVSSPCCGPVAAALAGMSAASASASFGASVLAAYALGHAIPLLAMAGGSMKAVAALGVRLAPALATVGGALMIGLGSYYVLLA